MRASCHIRVAANAPHRVSGDTIRKAIGNEHYRFILNCPNTNTYEMHLTLLSWWSVSELLSALTDGLEMANLSLKSKKPLSNSHSAATEGIHQGNGLPKAKFILHREFMEIHHMILSRFQQNTYNTQIVLVNRNISSGSFYLCYFGSNLWAKPEI